MEQVVVGSDLIVHGILDSARSMEDIKAEMKGIFERLVSPLKNTGTLSTSSDPSHTSPPRVFPYPSHSKSDDDPAELNH